MQYSWQSTRWCFLFCCWKIMSNLWTHFLKHSKVIQSFLFAMYPTEYLIFLKQCRQAALSVISNGTSSQWYTKNLFLTAYFFFAGAWSPLSVHTILSGECLEKKLHPITKNSIRQRNTVLFGDLCFLHTPNFYYFYNLASYSTAWVIYFFTGE